MIITSWQFLFPMYAIRKNTSNIDYLAAIPLTKIEVNALAF